MWVSSETDFRVLGANVHSLAIRRAFTLIALPVVIAVPAALQQTVRAQAYSTPPLIGNPPFARRILKTF
jgi:hypothetical protein